MATPFKDLDAFDRIPVPLVSHESPEGQGRMVLGRGRGRSLVRGLDQRGSIRMPVHMPLPCHFTRRIFIRFMATAGLLPCVDFRLTGAQPQAVALAYSYPMDVPGRPLGDGLLVRHGYATENTWYNPGWLHTGDE